LVMTILSEKNEERRNLIFELLDKEWERRVETISRTRKIESDDVLVICTLTLNREMGELAAEVKELREKMVTKTDLKWGLGVGLTIVTIIISLISLLV